METFTFHGVDDALPMLTHHVVTHGRTVDSRLGDTTREVRHVAMTLLHPLEREVLVAHRNADIVAQVAETAWVLSGRDDITWLGRYLPRAKDFSDDGLTWRGGYGPRLRAYGQDETASYAPVDQLAHVVDLLRADPNSRRAVINIYDAAIDVEPGKDIPCNDFLIFSLREKVLDLHVTIRSNDLIWGWSGINAFEWSVLLEVVAGLLDAAPGRLHFSIGSLHVYDRHFDRANKIAKSDPPRGQWSPAPKFEGDSLGAFDGMLKRWFAIEDMVRNGEDVFDRIEHIGDPLFEAFARIIAAHWSGDPRYLVPILGTRLAEAFSQREQRRRARKGESLPGFIARVSNPPEDEPLVPTFLGTSFERSVAQLHAEKHAAYGDSWKKRGEMFSIIPNIQRKVDRLGSGATTPDESQVDTAIDLLVYLVKYRWWLVDNDGGSVAPQPFPVDHPEDEVQRVAETLTFLAKGAQLLDEERLVRDIVTLMEVLEGQVMDGYSYRWHTVDDLLGKANLLARHRSWAAGNAARAWEPSEEAESTHTQQWPYRPTQPGTGSQNRSAATEMGPLQ